MTDTLHPDLSSLGSTGSVEQRRVLANGLRAVEDLGELSGVLLQVAAYAGVPAGIDGFRLAREAFAEVEAAKK